MIDEFANRHAMHLTILDLLERPENTPIWMGARPYAFTAKAAQLREKVTALGETIRQQEAAITGFAAQKEREAQDVETLAHELGSALAGYHEDAGREAEAAMTDYPLTRWQAMRETSLLEKARLVHLKLLAAIAADADGLEQHGLNTEDATALLKEIEEYARIIESPQAAKATRKALTLSLRPRFRDISELLQSMDRLVLRFRSTPAGKQFAASWKSARRINQLGHGPAPEVPVPQP
jgi:hypothetical protein